MYSHETLCRLYQTSVVPGDQYLDWFTTSRATSSTAVSERGGLRD